METVWVHASEEQNKVVAQLALEETVKIVTPIREMMVADEESPFKDRISVYVRAIKAMRRIRKEHHAKWSESLPQGARMHDPYLDEGHILATALCIAVMDVADWRELDWSPYSKAGYEIAMFVLALKALENLSTAAAIISDGDAWDTVSMSGPLIKAFDVLLKSNE